MADFITSVGATLPAITETLRDAYGPVNLTGCTVTFHAQKNGLVFVAGAAVTIRDAINGVVSFTPSTSSFTEPGAYNCQFEVEYPASAGNQMFPSGRYYTVEVTGESSDYSPPSGFDLAEYIRDTMGTALVAGTNITLTVSDVGNTITVASSGGGGGTAATTTFTPAGSIAATDVQAAIEEVSTEGAAYTDFVVGEHAADSPVHSATAIPFTPASGIAATTVQAAIEEAKTDATAYTDTHIADTSAAHAASAVSFSPASGVAATDVQAAIVEVVADAAGTYPTKAATTDLIDNAGDSLTGTADNTLGKLAKGTALQVRRMNAAANAEEWATVGAGSALFGDGSDGNLTVSGTTTITTDKNYDTLIVQSGGILIVAGARVRCKTLCQVDAGGIIHADGGAGAAAGTAGTATAQGMLGLPSAGGAGGTAAGSAGVTVASGSGGAGGAGGLGASGAGGAAGSFSSLLGNFGTTGRGVEFVMLGHVYVNGFVASAKGGAGGGGGGGDGTAGGGGGAGGGVFTLAAKSLTNAGSIRANGGAGGSPAAGNRGGGGGGGGGWIGLIYNTKSGAGTITCTGGTGGTKQGTGVNGTNGSDGTVMEFVNA